MRYGHALLAGVVGGAAMTLLGTIARAAGVPVNVEMLLGTMIFPPSTTAWVAGLVMHLVISAAIALVYAVGFERLTYRAGAIVGVLFSMVHIVIGGFAMLLIPVIHPLVPGSIAPPGPFMAGMGLLGILLFVLEHVVYGAIVGAGYGRVAQPGELAPRAREPRVGA